MINSDIKHIAIIMDGNRRWAKNRGLAPKMGHREGAKTLEKIVKYANKIGLSYITVYAFSTENWKRDKEEVDELMRLLKKYLDDYAKKADSQNIKVNVIGDFSVLSFDLINSINNVMEVTKKNTGITFNIALNYGGRSEILNAVKNIVKEVRDNNLSIDSITEEIISKNMYTKDQPDPDLMIRTSGEIRTSNFLPWQLVYSELYFVQKNWPDFNEKDLDMAIEEYNKRTRKYGGGN